MLYDFCFILGVTSLGKQQSHCLDGTLPSNIYLFWTLLALKGSQKFQILPSVAGSQCLVLKIVYDLLVFVGSAGDVVIFVVIIYLLKRAFIYYASIKIAQIKKKIKKRSNNTKWWQEYTAPGPPIHCW